MTPEIEAIKDELRACETVAEVNKAAISCGPAVSDLTRQGGDMAVMADQIKRLACYMRLIIRHQSP